MILSKKFISDYVEIPSEETIVDIAEKMTSEGTEYDKATKMINATLDKIFHSEED